MSKTLVKSALRPAAKRLALEPRDRPAGELSFLRNEMAWAASRAAFVIYSTTKEK